MVPVVMPNTYGVMPYQTVPQVFVQPGPPPTGQPQQQQPPQPQPIVISDEDVTQVHEMFPNIDVDVIKAIMETQRGNKDRTINSLLQMTSDAN